MPFLTAAFSKPLTPPGVKEQCVPYMTDEEQKYVLSYENNYNLLHLSG